jgi:predicted ATPase
MAVADAARDRFDAGVCWVSLAASLDGPTVVETVATAVGLRLPADVGGDGRLDLLADHIGGYHLLLVLDNCEHVVESCAWLCADLLGRCPELAILTTSRELLRVPGEIVWNVPPLTVPATNADATDIREADAVRMFVARAAAHGFHPPDNLLVDVSRVCQRVQGIPLAIELAAARVNVLTIQQIIDELTTSTRILTGGRRTAPKRQQTLEATIDWSYTLLDSDEKRFFEAVSVFSGGWTLDAASWCWCSDRTDECHAQVVDLTSRLIDKSLVRIDRDGPEARYTMFRIIHQYASHRLDDGGGRPEVEQRHLKYVLDLAERCEIDLDGPNQTITLNRLDDELDNIRAALGRAIGHGLIDQAVTLAGALWRYFYLRGRYAEGRDWLEATLRSDKGDAPSPRRARALRGAGYLAFLQCDYDTATSHLQAALAMFRHTNDPIGTALTLRHLGSIWRERADYDRAHQLYQESLQLSSTYSDLPGVAWSRHHLGFVCWLRNDLREAVRHATVALEEFHDIGDSEGIAWSQINLGVVALYSDDLNEAHELLQQSLARSQRLGYREGIAWSLNLLGVVSWRQGRLERAIHLLDESLAEYQELGDRWRTASVLEALAAVAWQHHDARYAAFLLGTAAGIRDSLGTPVPPCELHDRNDTKQAIQDHLGDDAFQRAWTAGLEAPLHAVLSGYPPESLSTVD